MIREKHINEIKNMDLSRKTITSLFGAINQGDIDAALSLYENNAKIIIDSGMIEQGKDAIRCVLEGFIADKLSLSEKIEKVIEEDGMIIYCFRNAIVGKCLKRKSTQIEGVSVIVLRRQAEGNYLVSMDCPWGASISF